MTNNKQGEDIMSVLLAHEKKGGINASAIKTVLPHESSDSSENEDGGDMKTADAG
jgi:transcription initiation factor TFIIE subunit alpha